MSADKVYHCAFSGKVTLKACADCFFELSKQPKWAKAFPSRLLCKIKNLTDVEPVPHASACDSRGVSTGNHNQTPPKKDRPVERAKYVYNRYM